MSDEPLVRGDLATAFLVLLRDCLQLGEGDDLLVIYDESLFPYFDDLVAASYRRPWAVTYMHIPLSCQRDIVARAELSDREESFRFSTAVDSALLSVTAVLNVLDPGLDTGPVRRALLAKPRSGLCRVAHAPGLNATVLELLARSPIQKIAADAEALGWALGEAKQAALITTDSLGKEYVLNLGLDGWDNAPFISSGVMAPGSWGNVTPGETFCCPAHERVNGDVCINGSVPGHVLKSGQEVVLTFEHGILIDSVCSSDSPAHGFFADERSKAKERDDQYWSTFAELGIGLNPAIDKLTGNPIFDEKAAKTAHVAIGDNAAFGHDVKSGIHADLVIAKPSLRLDNVDVLSQGALRLDLIEDSRRRVEIKEVDPLPGNLMYLREDSVHFTDGGLKRRLHRAHRVGFVEMMVPPVGAVLAQVARELKTFDKVTVGRFIQECPRFENLPTLGLLRILHHYRVLGFLDLPATLEG